MADIWNKYEPTAARKRSKPGREMRPKSLTLDMHAHVMVPRAGEIAAPHLRRPPIRWFSFPRRKPRR